MCCSYVVLQVFHPEALGVYQRGDCIGPAGIFVDDGIGPDHCPCKLILNMCVDQVPAMCVCELII
jgi:hypothetical protein